jgi:hypothetical protein
MAAGYVGEKTLVLAESPYDGFMQKFVELIHHGKADDYYRIFVMEAAAHGINMSYPYGAWMGNKARDAFYPPKDTALEVQTFLYDNDAFIGKKSGSNVLVLYDYRSNLFRDWQSGQGEVLTVRDADDLLTYGITYDDRAERVPYNEIGKKMIEARIPFDVCILGDGGLAADTFGAETLAGYDLVVSADCGFLTKNQAAVLREAAGKKLLYIYGAYGKNIDGELAAAVKAGARVQPDTGETNCSVRDFCRAVEDAYGPYRILDWDNKNIYVQQCIAGKAKVLHILNYAFDRGAYKTIPQKVILTLRQPAAGKIRVLTLDGSPVRVEQLPSAGGESRLKLSDLPCYAMLIMDTIDG